MAEFFRLPQVSLETELVHKLEGHLWLFEKTEPSALVESRRAAWCTLIAGLLFGDPLEMIILPHSIAGMFAKETNIHKAAMDHIMEIVNWKQLSHYFADLLFIVLTLFFLEPKEHV